MEKNKVPSYTEFLYEGKQISGKTFRPTTYISIDISDIIEDEDDGSIGRYSEDCYEYIDKKTGVEFCFEIIIDYKRDYEDPADDGDWETTKSDIDITLDDDVEFYDKNNEYIEVSDKDRKRIVKELYKLVDF